MNDAVSVAPPSPIARLFAPGLLAVRTYWRAFALIQLAAAVIVGAYFVIPPVHTALGYVADLQRRGGLPFAVVSAMLAGALLPEAAKLVTGAPPSPRRRVLFNCGFFAYSGSIVYYFYLAQDWLFDGVQPMWALVGKAVIDQGLFSPLWAAPLGLFAFAWERNRLRLGPTLAEVTDGRRSAAGLLTWLSRRLPPLWVPSWAFWLPIVILTYTLPKDLQFALFTLALAAWSLILTFVAGAGD